MLAIASLITSDRPSAAADPQQAAQAIAVPTRAERLALADQLERSLFEQELGFFYPACVDADRGGFRHSTPAEWARFTPAEREKNLLFQSRMVWTAAEVARRRPGRRETYLTYARDGFAFLRDHKWDREQGGFYWMVGEGGGPSTLAGADKHAYGIAFGIYGCANYYLASRDPEALDLALRAFDWLEEHGHDARHLLLMYDKTHEPRYWRDFVKMWDFIRQYGIDEKEGGWRFAVDPIKPGNGWKVHPTTAAYHTGRSMLNVIDRLRSMNP